MGRGQVGEQELGVLRYIAGHADIPVSEVVEGYGGPNGLARTTIVTMMERLRKKGYLTRVKDSAGVFRYTSRYSREELERELVAEFTRRMLGGSLEPFVAYVAEQGRLSDAEAMELRALLRRLDHDREAGA